MYDRKLNILYAYPYFTSKAVEEFSSFDRSNYRLIIDSGAFSAHNCGMKIELNDYHKFIESISFLKPDAIVQLDVVFNPKETKNNLKKSRDAGYNVCPVFTRGDEEDYLQQLVDEKEYVFVGGVQGGQGAKEFAKYILERYSRDKIHLLAFVRPDWLIHYKPYSVDSSSWSASVRYGLIEVFKNGRLKRYSRQDFMKRPDMDTIKDFQNIGISYNILKKLAYNESWITRKFDPEQLYNSNISCDNLHGFISLCSWIKYSIEYQNKIGTKIYIAVSQDLQLRAIKQAYKHLVDTGII